MSGKNKNYNSIIFLTTLSVCLGLVIVGAPLQILAQNSQSPKDKNKISILAPGSGMIFTFDLNPLIELNKLASKESLPVKFSGKLIPLQQSSTEWKLLNSEGSSKIIEFIKKDFFAPAILNPPTIPLSEKELFQSIEVDKNSIILTRSIVFYNLSEAEYINKCFRYMIDVAKSPATKNEIAGNLYLINTEVRLENDQVFIVTRLPRAGIDALIN